MKQAFIGVWGAARQDECTSLKDSSGTGAGIILNEVRENLCIRGGGLVEGFLGISPRTLRTDTACVALLSTTHAALARG